MIYKPREEDRGLLEYGLILMATGVVTIALIAVVGPLIGNVFSNMSLAL